MPHIIGAFSDPDDANRAYNDLKALGFADNDISVVMSHQTRRRYYGDGAGPGNGESHAQAGAFSGGVIGALIGAAIVAGTAAMLGGAVFATGPIGLALATIAGSAAAGSIIGALSHAGIPDQLHGSIDEAVKRGDIVLHVDAEGTQADGASKILQGFEDVTAPAS
jgi:hypothetical protein